MALELHAEAMKRFEDLQDGKAGFGKRDGTLLTQQEVVHARLHQVDDAFDLVDVYVWMHLDVLHSRRSSLCCYCCCTTITSWTLSSSSSL